MQDYRWVWTVIVLLIICYALISLVRVYWREWTQRRRARRADEHAPADDTSAPGESGSDPNGRGT